MARSDAQARRPAAEAAGGAAALRRVPAMHALLSDARLAPWEQRLGRARVREAASRVLEALRGEMRGAGAAVPDRDEVVARTLAELAGTARPRLRRVVNATGVVLHTGLGRAPLAPAAAAAAAAAASAYSSLELDLETGSRGSRHALVSGALRELTGAEAAMVVNNNAAAVLLLLAALAAGREVVVSRGELVEIGGSFRVPEVMAQSGARLREVGTTNRTYPADYRAAAGQQTALLLKVHRSNFRVVGFTAEAAVGALAPVAADLGVPLAYDMGSGALLPGLGAAGAAGEPDVRTALRAGASVVTFSGDKLLGGPQAGILCGRADLIRACARHPLARAVRVDKMTLAALEATLDIYRGGRAAEQIPVLAMLGRPEPELEAAARRLAGEVAGRLPEGACAVALEAADSAAGGGALPELPLPTRVVALRPARAGPEALARALRRGSPAVLARIRGGAVLLDPRTLLGDDARVLPALVAAAVARAGAGG